MTIETLIEKLQEDISWLGYNQTEKEIIKHIKCAITLLEQQKPMKPIYSEEKFGDFLPHCPVCKKVLPSISQYGKSKFCHNCGRAVK